MAKKRKLSAVAEVEKSVKRWAKLRGVDERRLRHLVVMLGTRPSIDTWVQVVSDLICEQERNYLLRDSVERFRRDFVAAKKSS